MLKVPIPYNPVVLHKRSKTLQSWASEMALQVKVLATKHDNLSLILRTTYMVKKEANFCKLSSDCHTVTMMLNP